MPSVKYGNKTSILIKNIAFISYVNGCGPVVEDWFIISEDVGSRPAFFCFL